VGAGGGVHARVVRGGLAPPRSPIRHALTARGGFGKIALTTLRDVGEGIVRPVPGRVWERDGRMATVTSVCYFKRYKMEVDLHGLPPPQPAAGFRFVAWDFTLLDLHAELLYTSFHHEIDSLVFPSLGNRTGCCCLMTEISRKWSFLPEATWLIAGPDGPCGTVQGVRERSGLGAIQNLGIAPA